MRHWLTLGSHEPGEPPPLRIALDVEAGDRRYRNGCGFRPGSVTMTTPGACFHNHASSTSPI
jgi:hypothetical protein